MELCNLDLGFDEVKALLESKDNCLTFAPF